MLKITAVLGSDQGYTRVILAPESFNQVIGSNPQVAFTEEGVANDRTVRVFDMDGVKLYSLYSPTERKTIFVVPTADAQKLFTAKKAIATPFDVAKLLTVAK